MPEIRPQEGFQEDFLASPADITIGGGAAGAGKTYVLLMEAMRNISVDGYGGVIFRRTTPQITNEGGLWDTARDLYPHVGGKPNVASLTWKFPDANNAKYILSKIKFSHLEYDDTVLSYQGTQIPFIGFDELTHFTKRQFFYLLSRNRSLCGVRPYVRATCNPDPDSWVAELINWWINPTTGYPIPERSGVLRYFIRDKNALVWGDTPEEVIKRCPHVFDNPQFKDIDPNDLIKSITFIPGDIYGNKELLSKNPAYLGNLLSQDEQEQMRLLKGNWKVRQDGTSLFNYSKVGDLFSNHVKDREGKYITCDYARFGRDFTTIKTWEGWTTVRIEVLTKSSVTQAFEAIETERTRAGIGRSNVSVDEDGVGGGVVDLSEGEYRGFHANASAMPNPITNIPEDYKNLKTQCYYRYADKVNKGEAAIDATIVVDGVETDEVLIGSEMMSIRKLISEDLRAIKKKNMDRDGKKQINGKDEQKNILNGRSPDFGDALSQRAVFELIVESEPGMFII